MRRALLRCYPARWRERYGDEFAALLDERPLGPFDVADVLLGALDAQLHLRGVGAASEHGRGFAMSLRIGGAAAIVGGLFWAIAFAGSGLAGDDTLSPVWTASFLVGTAGLLIALVGLSAFQARAHPLLIWSAFVVPAIGAAISLAGVLGMGVLGDVTVIGGLSPWAVWAIGTLALVLGSALFAAAPWRTGGLSRPGAAVLLTGSASVVPMLGLGLGDGTAQDLVLLVTVALFGVGWAWLGASAVRIHGRGMAALGRAALP
jgi:hypothetical protein